MIPAIMQSDKTFPMTAWAVVRFVWPSGSRSAAGAVESSAAATQSEHDSASVQHHCHLQWLVIVNAACKLDATPVTTAAVVAVGNATS